MKTMDPHREAVNMYQEFLAWRRKKSVKPKAYKPKKKPKDGDNNPVNQT